MSSRSESFTIEHSLPGERLDKFLATIYPAVSRGTLQRLIDEGHIKVNDLAITWPPGKAPVVITAYFDSSRRTNATQPADEAALAEVGRIAAAWATA